MAADRFFLTAKTPRAAKSAKIFLGWQAPIPLANLALSWRLGGKLNPNSRAHVSSHTSPRRLRPRLNAGSTPRCDATTIRSWFWLGATPRASFCGLHGQSQCVEWRGRKADEQFRSVQTAQRRTADRVAGGGCPPPAPTPPCVRFRTRRFTQSSQVSGARRAGSRGPSAAAHRSARLGSCGWRQHSTKGHDYSWPRLGREPHLPHVGEAS